MAVVSLYPHIPQYGNGSKDSGAYQPNSGTYQHDSATGIDSANFADQVAVFFFCSNIQAEIKWPI